MPATIRQAIREVRSELEVEASEPSKLSYVGGSAILARLRQKRVSPLPSLSAIERELRAAGMVRPRQPGPATEVEYPHLCPAQPHVLVQLDILPKYLTGGQSVPCFNAIDVVSRYPTGQQYLAKSASEALEFLCHVWQTLGIPVYTQLDNEGCFSGGHTHPYVLGKVLRMGLLVGTELVYSPLRHPKSNGTVERFHQDYERHVWDKTELADLVAVQRQSSAFFESYRCSRHHSALQGRSPAELHLASHFTTLPADFNPPAVLPLTEGRVHFMRLVNEDKQIRLLNANWEAAKAKPNQGVWATLELTTRGAKLLIYDSAPDVRGRICLAIHTFPIKEPVVALQMRFRRPSTTPSTRWWSSATRPVVRLLSTMF